MKATFLDNTKADSLNTEQLEHLVNTRGDILENYLKHETLFDENQVRILCELGQERARDMLKSNVTPLDLPNPTP